MEACGTVVQEVILKRIKEAKYFSAVFDETTDINTISQLSIVITYMFMGRKGTSILLSLLTTQEPKVTGELLGKLVSKKLKKVGLNVNLCVGIGTDGWSVMTSEKVGVVKEIQKEASNAFRCPCFNHALNLTISVSSCIVSIRNSIRVIKESIAFLTSSVKRRVVVDSICVRKIKKNFAKQDG
jgi:hypothetical protein